MAVIILPLLVFGTVAFIVFALGAPTESPIQTRLRTYGYSMGGRDLSIPFAARVIVPLLDKVAGLIKYFSPTLVESSIRTRLFQAGLPAGLDPSRFLAIKGVVAITLVAFALLTPLLSGGAQFRSLIIAVVLAIFGWKMPDLWLSGQISRRQKAIQRALPDALDLIVVCVEAGNALEAALANVARKLRGPLAEELERTLQEISLGKQRREALRDLSKRAGVADLQSFIAAILQADQLGVSIAQVLRVQAEAMRVRRRQRAEEEAAKAPVKMLFPLVMLIFPALMIVILGPAVLRIVIFFQSQRGPG
jgi:tight adherence protein C